MKLTQKDFKIGQTLVCIKLDVSGYPGGGKDNERLILGEKYLIEDLDIHFPDRVCVKLRGPYYFHSEFVPIECFVDVAYLRDRKINTILDESV
jgi:hypothetical protein